MTSKTARAGEDDGPLQARRRGLRSTVGQGLAAISCGRRRCRRKAGLSDRKAYFYRMHDLEHIPTVLGAAARDETTIVAEAFFAHLARNWGHLERFSRLELALVPVGRDPGRRGPPAKPKS